MSVYNNSNLFLINLLTKLAPRWFFRPLAVVLSVIFYFALGKERRGTRANLRVVTGKKNVELLIISSYYKFGLNWCDIMLAMRLSGSKLNALIGKQGNPAPMDAALAAGNGAILVSPHIGNWELGGFGLADQGYPVNVLTFREPDEQFNESRAELRSKRGISFIYVDREDTSPLAAIEAVNALRRNEVLAILADRDGSSNTIKIDFFGKPVNFPIGAAYLAMASGAPVIPVFVLFEKGRYTTIMEEPIFFSGKHGKHAETIRVGMEKLLKVFEHYIKSYPDQWYNFYDFWGAEKRD